LYEKNCPANFWAETKIREIVTLSFNFWIFSKWSAMATLPQISGFLSLILLMDSAAGSML
jgi:hypothetical protein